jgi:hypothetical protein
MEPMEEHGVGIPLVAVGLAKAAPILMEMMGHLGTMVVEMEAVVGHKKGVTEEMEESLVEVEAVRAAQAVAVQRQ